MESSGDSEIGDSNAGEDASDQENAGDDEAEEEEDDITKMDGHKEDDIPGCVHAQGTFANYSISNAYPEKTWITDYCDSLS